jgi:hypothetical protein
VANVPDTVPEDVSNQTERYLEVEQDLTKALAALRKKMPSCWGWRARQPWQ